MWYILCMNCCFAAALPFLKLVSGHISPFELVAVRMLLSGLILSVVGLIRGSSLCHGAINWQLLILTGCIGTYFLCGAEAWALQYMTATKATLLWGLLPLVTHGIAVVYNQEQFSWIGLAAITMGMIGVYLLVGGDMYVIPAVAYLSYRADGAMLCAIIAAALDYIGTKRLMDERHDLLMSNGIMMLVGGICSVGTAYVVQGTDAFMHIPWAAVMPYIMAIVILVNCIGLVLQSYLVRYYSVTLLALSSFLTPLLGVGMSIWWCHESWNMWYSLALFCIMGGVSLFYIDEQGRKTNDAALQEYL